MWDTSGHPQKWHNPKPPTFHFRVEWKIVRHRRCVLKHNLKKKKITTGLACYMCENCLHSKRKGQLNPIGQLKQRATQLYAWLNDKCSCCSNVISLTLQVLIQICKVRKCSFHLKSRKEQRTL